MAFEADPSPKITQDFQGLPYKARFGSLTSVFNWSARAVGWFGGDTAMLAVVAWSAKISHNLFFRYVFSVTLIAFGSYLIFGWPQLRLWNRERGKPVPRRGGSSDGPRVLFAKSLLDKGGAILFFAASLLEGPLIVGWWAGRVNHRHQVALTWASSWILALAWTGVYLAFSIWALLVVFLTVIGFGAYQNLKRSRG